MVSDSQPASVFASPRQRRIEGWIEVILFAGRWLMAPVYVGLLVILGAVMVKFIEEIVLTIPQILSMQERDLVMFVLSLIDLALLGPCGVELAAGHAEQHAEHDGDHEACRCEGHRQAPRPQSAGFGRVDVGVLGWRELPGPGGPRHDPLLQLGWRPGSDCQGEPRGRVLQSLYLIRARRAAGEMVLEPVALKAAEGVEGVHPGQCVHVLQPQQPQDSTPMQSRIRMSPSRIRVLTVPSATCRSPATSR